jgi:8-oxo-dGTP pyrophosphatase MutT (NUDIX family)
MYQMKYPVAFHPVDIAITRIHEGRVQMLLAQKVRDVEGGKNLWRIPGGFIDPWDSCAEEAALRESIEETSMKFGSETVRTYFDEYLEKKKPLTKKLNQLIEDLASEDEISAVIKQLHQIKISEAALAWLRAKVTYIGSTRIDDFRYRDSDHKVITSFYEIHPAKDFSVDGEGPFDDIARTKWFFLSDIKDEIMHPAHKPLFAMIFKKYRITRITDEIFEKADKMFDEMDKVFDKFVKSADEIMKDVETSFKEFFK